ncbi:GGDEF domain-containing protein [Mariprofundus erugo]|uniref:diguanylate cyclase n=2 Tax=Mariprofundus erugo TaxID=2528639 RepID=A0A5R9GYQ1_9PROT|nr:GGDEF domain-containing protein [Mariprofundus erugo]TLS69153.1 GGDEF domain-containing protein [Mariprofundus erugo]TLS74017.1 GGDEF domain-containing protein [Mariprofundus erugo]
MTGENHIRKQRDELSIPSGLHVTCVEPLSSHMMSTAVLERFRNDGELVALPVVDDQMRPLGLVTRRKTLSVFGHKFSHELNRRKSVDILMEDQAVILDVHTGIEQVSQAMTARDEQCVFDPAIMVCDGSYCGLLSVITVLRAITGIRLERAFDSNPLTHLPGNNIINREIDMRLQAQASFVLAYIDLDYFKVFNDHYGYERGDRVIQLVAGILRQSGAAGDFIGHIGGDDFVMLLAPSEWRLRLERVLQSFQRQSLLLYDASDRQCGYLVGENRQGDRMQFSLMSLSIAVVECEGGVFQSHVEVAEVAGEVKHKAKLVAGNSIVVNQRRY